MTFGQFAHAKWDEERDVTTNGKEEFVYYYKTNEQGQKLVLDKYIKRLIFIQKDRFQEPRLSPGPLMGLSVDF